MFDSLFLCVSSGSTIAVVDPAVIFLLSNLHCTDHCEPRLFAFVELAGCKQKALLSTQSHLEHTTSFVRDRASAFLIPALLCVSPCRIEGQHALVALWPLHQTAPLLDNVMLGDAMMGTRAPTAAAAPADGDAASDGDGDDALAPLSGHADGPALEDGTGDICERNMSSAIALLRVLQKLTKNRPIRQMAAVVEGGGVILKRMLRLENPSLNLYALKVIKGMAIFCGRGWRKTNMRLLSRCGVGKAPGGLKMGWDSEELKW